MTQASFSRFCTPPTHLPTQHRLLHEALGTKVVFPFTEASRTLFWFNSNAKLRCQSKKLDQKVSRHQIVSQHHFKSTLSMKVSQHEPKNFKPKECLKTTTDKNQKTLPLGKTVSGTLTDFPNQRCLNTNLFRICHAEFADVFKL